MGLNDHIDFDQGYCAPPDKYVCVECINDDAIRTFISLNAESSKCDYCNLSSSSDRIAAPLDKVVGLIYESITSGYDDPAVVLAFDKEEDRYIGKSWDTEELLGELGLEIEKSHLMQDIVSSIKNNAWADKDYNFGPEDEWLEVGWQLFMVNTKYSKRYTFLRTPEIEEESFYPEIKPYKMLDIISNTLNKISLEIILDKGTKIYRARISKNGDAYNNTDSLGPPPHEKATSGRMNAAGISVFYGAFDPDTAIKETYLPSIHECKASVGAFELLKSIRVLDLTALPETPSIFDEEERHVRFATSFIRSFVEDIGKPILKDGMEHIEYVPSQIVSEHLRYGYKSEDRHQIMGILYPSTKNIGQKCCVLFLDKVQCCDDHTTDLTQDDNFNPHGIKSKKDIEENLYLELDSSDTYVVRAGPPEIEGPL